MSRHKGMSSKAAIDADDLREIVDCHRRIQRIHAGLNHASPQILPLMAASATLKACWAELSGAVILGGWAYPTDLMPADGLAPGADRSGQPREKTHMDTSIFGKRD
ncbi:MAG: hypothetical protein ACK4MH_02500 [Brevundimonas sp.]|jgi:hypothetical protein|uniref:hypothetical protein n=1 Tax=Brevundimonas sp. TaxID=1871086 RepID=UPI003919DDE5